ncbi:MAG: chitobiase/beta-hexosaminidase C-terminal domain-containing protein, partial [Spirochaetales bacterium]|nr:chitobiase/beta-hexosaminidase C-terminal domain-containing protein [Spirochaetales bacterium]
GFHDQPFSVTLSTETAGATIRYTLDGSIPDEFTGIVYTGPLSIRTTACLRAIAAADGLIPSAVMTQTYIFADDVLRQSDSPAGFPDSWGWDETADPPGRTEADYAMDPEVVAAGPQDVRNALLALPSISLVIDRNDLFNQSSEPLEGGIYANPWQEGVEWERPASLELIYPDGSEGFQADCAVRIYGGMGRSPWARKLSFRLLFKSEYGPARLDYPLFGDDAEDRLNTIILRANFNDGWHMLWDHWKLERVQLVRDEWARATQIAMGSYGSHGIFVHLYIDGLYWGIYNPVERPDAAFSAGYCGGDPGEWDSLHDGEPVEGDRAAWEAAIDQANIGLGTNEAYQRIQGNNPDGTPNPAYEDLLDAINLADYMLLNFYAGTEDWDIHNWYAARRKTDSEGYRFYVWDAEITNLDLNANLTDIDTPGCPSRLFQALRGNAEFRMLFADRVQRHLFNDGALTAVNAAARYRSLTDLIYQAVAAESARWGDAVNEIPYTRDREWAAERDALLYDYFPKRTEILLGQLIDAGLFPEVSAPVFYINGSHQHGGPVSNGDILSISAASGTIWYTLDNSDPRLSAENGRIVLIPRGAEWQFLDDGSDQGSEWRSAPVDWPVGPAELGYGDGDERTIVNRVPSGSPDGGSAITAYFRHSFVVDDAQEYDSLILRLVRDDGAVVYLNGHEIARSNMPAEVPVLFDTPAFDAAGTESAWFEFFIDPSGLLVDGENIMAVEIHQWSPTSSDISFDLELLSESGVLLNPSAMQYTTPVTLNNTTPVKARVLDDGVWSALTEAAFSPDGL